MSSSALTASRRTVISMSRQVGSDLGDGVLALRRHVAHGANALAGVALALIWIGRGRLRERQDCEKKEKS